MKRFEALTEPIGVTPDPYEKRRLPMANRKRNIQMKFYVTEEEKRLIDEKMAQLPTRRYGAYLRKMAIPFLLKSRLNPSFNWGLTFYLQALISAAVQVMVDEKCVVAVHRDRRVIQRRQQIFLDIADIEWCSPASVPAHTRCGSCRFSRTGTSPPRRGSRPRRYGSSPGWSRRYPP